MKAFIFAVLLFFTVSLPVTAIHPEHVGQPYRPPVPTVTPAYNYLATVTAFTCDDDPRNPMRGCTHFANGERVDAASDPRAACPKEWLGDYITLSIGTFRCVDTPREGWYDGWGVTPHIDLFMYDYDDAKGWGKQFDVPLFHQQGQ